MKLSEKILTLRKRQGMSQEELAERLNVSRQAISRWEVGSAQPDASNILQLSKLFGVSADYLLNDDYESDSDIPAVQKTAGAAKQRLKTVIALCAAAIGLFSNFVIYLLSRFIEVEVPVVTYQNGKRWYTWSADFTDHSYKYFIWEYDLEVLTAVLWLLVIAAAVALVLMHSKSKKNSK